MTLKAIQAHPFCRGLRDDWCKTLAGSAEAVTFDPGAAVCRTGDPAHDLYLIQDGRIVIETHAATGPLAIQTLGGGDVLGWSWLVPPHEWRFDARAEARTHATRIDGEALRDRMGADAELGHAILQRLLPVLAGRLEHTRIQLLDVYAH